MLVSISLPIDWCSVNVLNRYSDVLCQIWGLSSFFLFPFFCIFLLKSFSTFMRVSLKEIWYTIHFFQYFSFWSVWILSIDLSLSSLTLTLVISFLLLTRKQWGRYFGWFVLVLKFSFGFIIFFHSLYYLFLLRISLSSFNSRMFVFICWTIFTKCSFQVFLKYM